ncbi:T9SS type A sorting domain-containing protein [Flammeovirga pectinis]|uniref:T9SS type A sorting domain-containing protein n=1 Tax=Flammeovirga pectinis TaxID=2494373 RepID=A0A3S9NYN8_9BACT|nr:T9SS type A sorting domain-containing protein [Flammeovirga pectinis]AZQ60956.1 T9SS type A sorting domain-containing protein [Flammeovirga pectinis]
MKHTLLILITYLFCLSNSYAQNIGFVPSTSIVVENGNQQINNAWSGGLNAVQLFNIDLNLNGTQDLVIFDRSTRKIYTYLWNVTSKDWLYTPQYEEIFPSDIRFWIQIQDINGSGKKDLIIGREDGIYLHTNSSESQLSFNKTPVQLQTTTFSGATTPLVCSLLDTPAFSDVNGDGLLDFLTFVPGLGGTIEYHQNTGGNSDAPSYTKKSNNWGNFQECGDCATYVFGDEICGSNGRIMHLGSAISFEDINGSGLKDLLIGEMNCSNLVALPNKGTESTALFDESISDFPSSHPVNFPLFPASFFVDVNNNGQNDMVVGANLTSNEGDLTNFSNSIWLYKNTGTTAVPEWTFIQENFLQSTSIDLGERSKPFAYDVNKDGLDDLLVGYRGTFNSANEMEGGGIAYFQNIGNTTTPKFKLIDLDYYSISKWGMIDINPQIVDLTGNGVEDLVISARTPNSNKAGIYLFSASGVSFDTSNPTLFFEHRPEENTYLYDIDDDGKVDILLGTFGGELQYYKQTGTLDFVLEDNEFKGINDNLLRKYPSAFITDFDKDGTLDLLVWDDSGTPRVWRDFKNDNSTYQSKAFYNKESDMFTDRTYGNKLSSTVVNDFLITGSEGGGLYLATIGIHEAPTTIEDNITSSNLDIKVYPNPTFSDFTIANNSKSTLQVNILSINGNLILENSLTPNSNLKVSTQKWVKGIYILQFTDVYKSTLTTKKVLVK